VRLAHRIIGLAGVVLFLASGMYMRMGLPDLPAAEMRYHLLLRSRHIYLLAGALVNVALGLYLTYSHDSRLRRLQAIGSGLVLAAPLLLAAAFLLEAVPDQLDRSIARWGLFSLFGGMLMHLVGGWRAVRE
jgi:hypothetical protein